MKQLKSYILFVWMALVAAGCAYEDLKDDVNRLDGRVTLIEEQVKILNDNLEVMSYILDPQNKTINSVQTTGEQHVITLSNGDQLVLTVGAPGTIDEPEIMVGEDKCWYINGESTGVSAVGTDGKNGAGFPEFRVNDDQWEVRFGIDGTWKAVEGGTLTPGTGSLGDQVFESATKEGDNFVVTLKDGYEYTLPIVPDLVCAIDEAGLSLNDGYLLLGCGTRTTIPVKIKGDNPQVAYPQGWRAALVVKDAADAQGNTHTLYIYAPAAKGITHTRAVADNEVDVAISVQQGMLWAVDKIRVKIETPSEPEPEEPENNMDKYNAGKTIVVNGMDINSVTYGDAVNITTDATISADTDVYFVSADNITLTCMEENKKNLVILPASDAIRTIKLKVTKTMNFTGTIVCQHVELTIEGTDINAPFSARAENVNFVLDKCKINGVAGSGNSLLKRYSTASPAGIVKFSVTDSDIKFATAGTGYSFINGMDCADLLFSNNRIYFSGEGNLKDLKVFAGGQKYSIEDLNVTSNTLVDVESSGNSASPLIMTNRINQLVINNNLWRIANTAQKASFFIGGSTNQTSPTVTTYGTIEHNYGYIDNGKKMSLFQKAPENFDMSKEVTVQKNDILNTSEDFNLSEGIFTPIENYKEYGAQR